LVVLATASAACERAPLNTEAPRPVAPRAVEFAQSANIRSDDSGGGIPLTPTGIRVPSPRWVRLRATGSVHIEGNPTLMNGGSEFCQIFMSHCFPPLAGRSAGPEGIEPCAGCGPVLAVVLSAGPALYFQTIRTGSDAVVFLRPEWPVGVERGSYNDVTAAGRWRYNTYVYRADDLRVEAQEVEPPYTLAVSDTVFRSFRPIWATLHGPQADAAILSYMFVPGDTAAEPQSWGTDPKFTPKHILCRDSVCPVHPDAAGRIYAWVTHRSHPGLIVGPVLRPARSSSARLVLTCTGDLDRPNRVTRGKEVTCTASKNPATAAGELKITGWSFEGRARTDGDVTANEWKGVMVEGGTVEVRGTIGDRAVDPAATRIDVTDRTWAQAPAFTIREIKNGEDPRLTLPERVTLAHDLGAANFFRTPDPAALPLDPVGEVTGGPNHEIYYYENLSFPVYAYYVLNRTAMSRGSSFYNAQEQDTGSSTALSGGVNWCSQSVVSGNLLALVEDHELEHIKVYQATFTSELAPIVIRLEKKTSTTLSELSDEYEAILDVLEGKSHAASLTIHARRGNPNVVAPRDRQGDCALKNEDGQELANGTP
jgi:hypothetical protein